MALDYKFDIVITDIEPDSYEILLDGDSKLNFLIDADLSYLPVNTDHYTGTYVVTPSQERQVLLTENKILSRDIVVNAIPSNYGLITWNGTVLTVS